MIKSFLKHNLFFYLLNLILISLYLSPPNIVSIFFNSDLYFNFKNIPDLKISFNHIYGFLIFSFVGLLTYKKKNHLIILSIYLISLSIILELIHILLPYRGFESADIFGNITGVVIALVITFIYKKYRN